MDARAGARGCSHARAAAVDDRTVEQALAYTRARVHDYAERYAASIRVDTGMVDTCRAQFERDTANPPTGSIPYGVDYHQIPDTRRLGDILDVREAHERSYLMLCLAKAKTAPAADPVDARTVEQALAYTRARVHAAAVAHAEQLGIEKEFVEYCRVQLERDTVHSVDGTIPYGVDYRGIADTHRLTTILDMRESLERGYLLACLDNANAALEAAEG